MSAPQAMIASLELNEGPIEYRVYEDFLEITVGKDGSPMMTTLNLSTDCVTTLLSVLEHALPTLRTNTALLAEGRKQDLTPPHEYTATIGQLHHHRLT